MQDPISLAYAIAAETRTDYRSVLRELRGERRVRGRAGEHIRAALAARGITPGQQPDTTSTAAPTT